MNVPILDLHREYSFLKKEIQSQIQDCFNSQQWILGPKVSEFEEKAAKYLGVKYAMGVASGTDALILSLSALALKLKHKGSFDSKDEIITTPFTFIATSESIVRSGAKPVFVDINPETFNIDSQEIEKAITKRTVGIMPVHLYGLPCNMDEIRRIAKKYNLFIIEDAAQSFGAGYKGKKTGTLGDCGSFSFFPSKNLGSFGDGGLIATNNKSIQKTINILRNHGQTKQYSARYLGFNSRLDSLQAAILLTKLKYIDKFNKKRIEIANQYNQALKNTPHLQLPQPLNTQHSTLNTQYSIPNTGFSHIYHLYTIKVSTQRDKLLNYLNSKGIGARVYYPVTMEKMSVFSNFRCIGKLNNALSVSRKVISLPIHPFLNKNEIDYVIKTVYSFFND